MKCLFLAKEKNFRTIAFPSIGTGNSIIFCFIFFNLFLFFILLFLFFLFIFNIIFLLIFIIIGNGDFPNETASQIAAIVLISYLLKGTRLKKVKTKSYSRR